MQNTLGPLIVNIDGYKLTTEDIELISHPLIGGIILFENNYKSHQQVIDLIDNVKNIKNNLIISIDHEGGRVQRFKKNFTKLPSFSFISQISNSQERDRLAMCCGFITGYELSEIGINLNYSPVIDILHPSSRLLKDRTFGSDKHTVITLSMSYIKGIIKAGVLPVLKHYPGHGSVDTDSHTQICTTGISIKNLLKEDLVPFIEVLKNYSLPVMTNHVLYDDIDEVICSYSKKLLNDIPRDIFKPNPVFISDDLEMHAAKYFNNKIIKCEDRVISALKAGCQYVICTSKLVENIDEYKSSSHYFTENYLSDNLLNYTRQNHANIKKLQFITRTGNKMHLYKENLRLIKSYKYG